MEVVRRLVGLAFALACVALHANGETEAPIRRVGTVQAELNRYLDIGKNGVPLDESECPMICTQVWEPICGNNGVTYANGCWADNAMKCQGLKNLEIAHTGHC